MDRPFPPPGVKLVASNYRNLKVIFKLCRQTLYFRLSQRAEPSPSWFRRYQENPYRTRCFRVLTPLRRRGCAPWVPVLPGGDRAAREGRKWREGCRAGQESDSEKQQTTNGPQAERGTLTVGAVSSGKGSPRLFPFAEQIIARNPCRAKCDILKPPIDARQSLEAWLVHRQPLYPGVAPDAHFAQNNSVGDNHRRPADLPDLR